MSIFDDHTPRYVPEQVIARIPDVGYLMDPVKQIQGFPPHQHPEGCPLLKDISVIRVETVRGGVRWFGCDSFRINAELRMVITGTNSRDIVRMRWEPCKVP